MAPKKKGGLARGKAKAKAKGAAKARAGPKGSPAKRPRPAEEEEDEEEEDPGQEAEAAEEPQESSSKRARATSEDAAAPDIDLELPAFEVEEAAEAAAPGLDLELPAFDAQEADEKSEDDDCMPVADLVPAAAKVPRKTEPAGAGTDLTGDDDEGDVWAQLETELRAPLHLPVADSLDDAPPRGESDVHTVDDKDSDDEWGVQWTGSNAQQRSSILDEIQKNVALAADFHKEKWEKKEEVENQEEDFNEDGWGMGEYESKQEKEANKEKWTPDEDFSAWTCNSKEAVAAERLVQKIRSRAGKQSQSKDLEPFPNESTLEVLKLWIGRERPEQRMLLATLLWIEAITVEVPIVRPDLNQYAVGLLAKEESQSALRTACEHVSVDALLVKAGSPIPDAALRNEEAPKVQKQLISSLSGMLTHADFQLEEDDLMSMFEEIFADMPLSLRLASLVHLNEKAELLKKLWDDKSELRIEMGRLASFSRGSEVVCRLSLQHAVQLAQQAVNKDFGDWRKCKIDSLNRMGGEWRIVPNPEHLMQLHTLTINRQLQILLSIERDIELKWYELSMKVKQQDERSRQLRAYLVFEDRLRPYLLEEDLVGGKQKRDLQTESGQSLDTKDLAGVRQGVTEVFKKLKQRYHWRPTMTSRIEVSRVNWVARLSAVVRLAMTTKCLFADDMLRRLLREDEKRKLGKEIYDHYRQWHKLERGDGLAIKAPRVAPSDTMTTIRQRYEEYGKSFADKQRYQPSTPAGLGAAGMTPGVGGGMMTPGIGSGTPGFMPGNMTPGSGSRTPFNLPSSAEFGPYEKSEGNTPKWKPSQTPLGAPSTPQFQQQRGGTPAGAPPPTPSQAVKGSMTPPRPSTAAPSAFTPAGVGAAPGTPAEAFGARGTPLPFTPGPPGTPGGQPPPTPGRFPGGTPGRHAAGTPPTGAPPPTPSAANANPFTPASANPFTPAGAPPPTPGPGTPGGRPPQTPRSLAGGTHAPITPVPEKDENLVKMESV